ncbi:MAG: hypothetical protein AUJ49_04015 [Desulfovibrionaceae bacterium CG1_02_65_16]|nr:MAG: hypothetical protein AUJ49_04015 [Desulfovibrionaceae bacterium CG1_02_65_16]
MRRKAFLSALALFACLILPCAASAAESEQQQPLLASLGDQDASAPQATAPAAPVDTPLYMDKDLAREHERFSNFAHMQVERMNANIIGGRQHMQVHKGSDGLYHASYRAIDLPGVVCQVRRSESNPSFYVGNLIYKEQVLESVGRSADDCRKGHFAPVSERASRLIYTSKRGGGWN